MAWWGLGNFEINSEMQAEDKGIKEQGYCRIWYLVYYKEIVEKLWLIKGFNW